MPIRAYDDDLVAGEVVAVRGEAPKGSDTASGRSWPAVAWTSRI